VQGELQRGVGRVGSAVLVAACTLVAAAGAGSAVDKPVCTATNVCATHTHRPDPVAASTATKVRNVAQDTTLTNGDDNKLSQVEFRQVVPPGFTFVKDALGECSESAGTVRCIHGLLPTGQTVANTLVYRTPVLADGTVQTSTFSGKWCWAGCDSHDPDAARVDSIDVPEDTTVKAVADFDATFLLAGSAVALATGGRASETDPLAGTWSIPGQAADLAATATESANPPGFDDCPADGKSCRSGPWFRALSPGTTTFSPYSTVDFTQYRDLIPPKTSEKTYEVVYTACLPGVDGAPEGGCPLERLDRCKSASDRCTESVTKLPGGDYRVTVRIGSHNGYMK
jgi:hypothetical protein